MNRKQKKEWLKEAWRLAAEIEYCEQLMEDPLVYSSPGFGERVQASKGNSQERKTAKLLADVDKAVKDRDKAKAELEKRKAAVNALKDITQRKVLWLRYICHYTWNDVSMAVRYSRSNCYNIERTAIDNLTV